MKVRRTSRRHKLGDRYRYYAPLDTIYDKTSPTFSSVLEWCRDTWGGHNYYYSENDDLIEVPNIHYEINVDTYTSRFYLRDSAEAMLFLLKWG